MRLPWHVLFVLALVQSLAFCQGANSQTNPEKKTTGATISGRVTIKGKPAHGIAVGVTLYQDSGSPRTSQAITDEDGFYHITGVPIGSVSVAPVALPFVTSMPDSGWKSLVVTQGDAIEGIDFDLTRGGVITGKVTDTDGSPIIAQRVSLLRVDRTRNGSSSGPDLFETDDRGIYRMFGLTPGSYKVFVRAENFGSTVHGRSLPSTYHPNTTDSVKAAIIEVGEGTESTGVDIVVSRSTEGFAVSGQVIDRETNASVSNAAINLMRITVIDANSTSGEGGATDVRSDASGAFRLDKVPPGKYMVSIDPPPNSSLIVEPVNFDVVDSDVSGLVIKASTAASVSGTVVIEGEGPDVAGGSSHFWVYANLRNNARGFGSTRPAQVNDDGSFHAVGLQPGTVSFSAGGYGTTGNAKRLTISRIERDGVVQPNALTIQGNEQIKGIRIVLSYSSGAVRGVVKLLNGTLSRTARLGAQLIKPNDPNERSIPVDERGHFLIENVAPGTYDLLMTYYEPGTRKFLETKQSVTVTDGKTTEVEITLDLSLAAKP